MGYVLQRGLLHRAPKDKPPIPLNVLDQGVEVVLKDPNCFASLGVACILPEGHALVSQDRWQFYYKVQERRPDALDGH